MIFIKPGKDSSCCPAWSGMRWRRASSISSSHAMALGEDASRNAVDAA